MDSRSRQSQTKITRRLAGGVVAAALGALTTAPLPAHAAANFTVPKDVKRIRVRSYREGKLVIDTEIDVTPGQTFRIDPV